MPEEDSTAGVGVGPHVPEEGGVGAPPGAQQGEQISRWAADGTVDTVIMAFPDLQGRLVGKRLTADYYLRHAAAHGIEACDYLLAVDIDMRPLPGYAFTSWESGYGDLVARPDYATARRLPWLEGTALVLCDLCDHHGEPVAVSPRRILQRQVERAAERGLTIKCATELEFYLFRDSPDEARRKGWHGLEPHSTTVEDYQIFQTTGEEYILRRVRNELLAAGVPVECSKGEAGRGQHEVNVTYADPVQTADRHLLLKSAVKDIAAQEGRAVTFMAKWTMEDSGSSCHIHTSLWDADSGAPASSDEGDPRHLSAKLGHFLAGQLHAARQLAWCSAPTLNSYRRYVPGSWAPTAVVWGEDNRTCGFRVVGREAGRRIESRVPGADANPYLALAATIAAGLYGLDHELDPGTPYTGNGYEATDVPRLPTTLIESIDELEHSAVATEAFGPEVHDHLVHTARQEWLAANQVVTDWELARNFERI